MSSLNSMKLTVRSMMCDFLCLLTWRWRRNLTAVIQVMVHVWKQPERRRAAGSDRLCVCIHAVCLCVFVTGGMKETDSSIRLLFVPCLDKRRCFLWCLHDSLGSIVWKQQRFIVGKGIIRGPSLVWERKGDGNGVEGPSAAGWVYCKLGEGCVCFRRGDTKDLG